jgi:hypothetical protein
MGVVEVVGERREGKIMKKSEDFGEAGDKYSNSTSSLALSTSAGRQNLETAPRNSDQAAPRECHRAFQA